MASREPIIEYLTTTRIGEKGQLTVPLQFRDDLGLSKGAPFAVLRLGDGLILLPEQQRFEKLCEELTSSLASAAISEKEFMTTLPEARSRVYERRYGGHTANRKTRRKASSQK
jgi:AbrB family looped-hinge helix DNA binding protein